MSSKPQTVLVVEDEASIASFVAAYLRKEYDEAKAILTELGLAK